MHVNKTNYRKDIDALRGIAVSLVVIYHAFPKSLTGGFIGVDVFFVISGYLITSIIAKQIHNHNFSFVDFYMRRIRRIFPSLIVVILSALIIGWLILFPNELKQLGDHVFNSTFFLQNYNLINEMGYFDVSSHYKPLLHLWTLSIEEQYYLFWPVILVVVFKLSVNPKNIIIIIIGVSFFFNIYLVEDYKHEVFFHSLTRFWELGAGSLLAIVSLENNNKYSLIARRSMFVIGITGILLSSILIKSDVLYPSWIALFPILGSMLVIYANIQLKRFGGLVQIGLISYPLYLWHWVFISYAYIYLGKTPELPLMLIIILISVILSFLTYKYVEKIRYSKSNASVLGLLLIAMTTGVIGLIVEGKNGLENRRHLSYLEKYSIEFKRTPAIDGDCDSYVTSVLNEKRYFDYCRFSNTQKNKKMVAIIGDSHAHVLFPGISKEANKQGYGTVLLANSSCPPLIGFKWGKNMKDISMCQSKIQQILKILSLDKRINKVIFSTRGPVYIHGEVDGVFTTESVSKSLNSKISSTYTNPIEMSYKRYFNGFDKTLNVISRIKHIENTYYFLENPELDFLPKEVIPRPFDYFGVSIQDSTMDYSLYKLRMKEYQRLTYKKSSNYNSVSVIDVSPYLCDKKRCYSYKSGNFLYADDDHFSIFGSYYIADSTKDIIFSN